ncbi:MAG: HAD family hydrolase [Candidatus Pacebacteria bacterium]|nr:HAD family hydrolase [Candidatus Paceibacterota bacterium]
MNNSTKIILFDVDGVLLNLPYYFGEVLLEKGYKINNILDKFYSSDEYQQSFLEEVDLEKIVEPYLKEFGWEKSSKEYFDELFEFEAQFFNQELLDIIKKIKETGVECILCTNKNKIRFNFVINYLKDIFEKGFTSCDVGFLKNQEEFWKYVLKNLKERYPEIKPEEIAFFDDKQVNIDVASRFGLNSFLFTDIDKFKKDLDKLIK